MAGVADQFAEVVFPTPLKQVFTYRVPGALENLVVPGMRCLVPFGRRRTVGLVTGLVGKAPAGVKVMKSIYSLLDTEPSLTSDLLQLGQWIADYYYCSLGESLFAMLPVEHRKNPITYIELLPDAPQAQVELLLQSLPPLRGVNFKSLQAGKVALTPRTKLLADALEKENFIRFSLEGRRSGAKNKTKLGKAQAPPVLHAQQQAALSAIEGALGAASFKTFLLQGVTGSGKTEVYLRAIAKVIEKGQQAIVLIPEIALTPQTVERFTSRFGDQVAVLHSRLSPGERTLQWRRMALGEAKVAVGARSALFAPAKNLGLIVVDEEHESSYKQDKSPRYHARDAAVMRAQIGKAVALLGSATPSLESVHNARTGKYSFLAMPDRVNQRPLPKIKLINLREEWQVRGQDRPVLSMALEAAIRETLEKKEQVLLFLNRRGFNTLTLCMKCGEQVHCPNCSVPVTFHRGLTVKGKPALLCHYCDWKGPVPEKCPQCLDGDIQQVGLGTEKVEEEMKAKFPGARIGRMDLDTTRKQGSHEDIITRFRNHEIDLLVGTQMIAKGHDFPGVTLVGIVGADTGLALPDFRSSEKVFQLLVQVAGRAGRAEKEGIIYLQTFNPDHAAIQAAQRHDTGGFWKNELELRQALNYPPFCRLAILMYQSPDEKKAREAAEKVGQLLDKAAPAYQVQVLGPAPAAMFKLQSNYRFQILLKAAKASSIRQLIQNLDSRMTVPSGVLRVVDIDPQSML